MADRNTSKDGKATSDATGAAGSSGPGPGFRLGEYTIRKSLGHGSMATVYLAHDASGHAVALKIFQEGPGVSSTLLERFRREAEASKKLRRHPNIMKVYATGQEGPYHFIVMEPVHHSRTFDDLISGSQSDLKNLTTIVMKIARALHFAHTHHIVHRDVKPTNIMIDEFGEPLLTDFGVAAMIDLPTCTMTGALTGTPLYMSPEQARSEKVGPESDVYSLAVVLYESLTGVLPYSTQHAAPVKNVLEAVRNEMPVRPRHFRKDISPDLEAVIMKALQKKAGDRYPDAESFALDLELALAGRPVSAEFFSIRDRFAFLFRRHAQAIAVVSVAAGLLAGLSLYYQVQLRETHYLHLIDSAQRHSVALQSMGPRHKTSPAPRSPGGVQQELMLARNCIKQSDWSTAAAHLDAAIRLADEIGDKRSKGTATMELARIRLLDGDHAAALELYKHVIANPDTPQTDMNQALFEALLTALLFDHHLEVIELIARQQARPDHLLANASRVLSGEINILDLQNQMPYLPPRLHNDAYLALAVRYKMDGNRDEYRRYLQQSAQQSSPAREWPGPLARKLHGETR